VSSGHRITIVCWQAQGERTPLSSNTLALGPHRAPVGLNHLFYQCQAQAHTAEVPGSTAVNLVEAIEKLPGLPGTEAGARGPEDLWLPREVILEIVRRWQGFMVPGGKAKILTGPRTGEVGDVVAIWHEGCCTSVVLVLPPGREGLYRLDELQPIEED